MCVFAYLPAPTVTVPSPGPGASLLSQPAVRSTPEHPVCTGALALIPLDCSDSFTHLPLCQTVNYQPPALPRTGVILCLIHPTSGHTSHAKVIRSNHSFIPGVIQSISKHIPIECSELDAVRGLGGGFKVSNLSFIHSLSLIQQRGI